MPFFYYQTTPFEFESLFRYQEKRPSSDGRFFLFLVRRRARESLPKASTLVPKRKDPYVLVLYIKVFIYFQFFPVNNQGRRQNNRQILLRFRSPLPVRHFHIYLCYFDSYSDRAQALIEIYFSLFASI